MPPIKVRISNHPTLGVHVGTSNHQHINPARQTLPQSIENNTRRHFDWEINKNNYKLTEIFPSLNFTMAL